MFLKSSGLLFKNTYEDLARLEGAIKNSQFNFTIIRPTQLFDDRKFPSRLPLRIEPVNFRNLKRATWKVRS